MHVTVGRSTRRTRVSPSREIRPSRVGSFRISLSAYRAYRTSMGKFVGVLAAIVLVATVVATGWVTPASPSVARAASTASPSPAATVPIGWHVSFNGTGSPRHLAVDAARDRVLFTAYIASSSDTRFFVTDSNGTMQGNVSIGPWVSNYGAH